MDQTAALFETTRCLCLASRRAARRITRQFDEALREHGLRSTQFTLLSALALAGPMSIGKLAGLLAADRTTITRNLGLVEKRGLVTIRASHEDARSRIAAITAAGSALLTQAFPSWRKAQHELVDALGPEAAAGLQQLAGGPCVMPFPDPDTSQGSQSP